MKKRYLLMALLISAINSNAQDTIFSLNQAKEYALAHSVDILNSRLDLEQAEKKVWETTAMGLPQVSAKAEFQNFINIPTTVVPAQTFNPLAPAGQIAELKFGTDYNLKGTLQVSQLIFSGNYIVGLQASKAFTNTSQILIEKQEIEVKYNVTEAYLTVLFLESNKGILDSTLINMQKLLDETQILVNEKVLESTNASQLRLSVLNVQNGIRKIDYQINVAKNLLKFQMGMPIEHPIILSDTFNGFTQKETPTDELDVTENIDHKIVASQLELNELALKNKKANYLPTLSGFFSYQQSAQRYEFNFFDSNQSWYPTTLWGITLSVPVFSSGQRASQVSQAKIDVYKAENSLANVEQALKLQFSQAIADYNSAIDIYVAQQEALLVAKEILDHTTIKYKEGVVNSMELTQAQSQYLTTQTDFNSAAFNLIKAQLKLDKLINKL
jgi:outer membrane protein TolC